MRSGIRSPFSSLSLLGGSAGDGAITAQNVIDLFNSGAHDGLFYNIADTTANKIARDGTGGDVTDGSALGRRLDLSGNDIHGVAPSDAARGTWDLVSGLGYQTMDGSDDSFAIEHDFNALMRVFMVLNTTDTQFIPISNSTTSYLFASDDGSSSTTLHNVGAPRYKISNVDFAGSTRDNSHDTAAINSPVILEIINAPFNEAGFNRLGVAEYTGGFRLSGLVGSMIILPETLIASNYLARTTAYNFLASQVGLSLLAVGSPTPLQTMLAHFSGVSQSAVYDITDPAANNVDTDGDGADVTHQSALGRRLDVTGNGRHLSSRSDVNRGTWQTVAGLAWHSTNKAMVHADDLAADMRIYMNVRDRDNDTASILVTDFASSAYVGLRWDGVTNLPYGNSGTPTHEVDGIDISPNDTNALHEATDGGTNHLLVIKDVDMETNWSSVEICGYENGVGACELEIGSMVFIPTSEITAQVDTDIRAWLQSQYDLETYRPLSVIAVGDSITLGGTGGVPSYMVEVTADINWGGPSLDNNAVGSSILQNGNYVGGSPGADNLMDNFEAFTITPTADALVCSYGYNDARYTAQNGVDGFGFTLSAALFKADLQSCCRRWFPVFGRANIWLVTPHYISDAGLLLGGDFGGQSRVNFEAYVTACREVAEEFGYNLVDTYAAGAPSTTQDDIHPDAAGNAEIAAEFDNATNNKLTTSGAAPTGGSGSITVAAGYDAYHVDGASETALVVGSNVFSAGTYDIVYRQSASHSWELASVVVT